MPLLIDIGAVPECTCNDHLEGLFKALAQDPLGDPESIWAPVENPWIRTHVEDVTRRFQSILEKIQDVLARFLLGEGMDELQKADVPWLRWSESEFAATRARLEAKGPANFTLEDYMLLVDYLIQRYLPDGVINSEADYLAVRAVILGKIQANMDARGQKPNMPQIEHLAELVPTDFGKLPDKVLSPMELNVLRFAKARAAENISAVTEEARHGMKTIILEHVQAQVLGMKQGQHIALRQRLFDRFGQLNRDFRRIAVTEAGEACNQGYIATMQAGQKVKRVEAYKGACSFCRSINCEVFTVVSPDKPQKNGDTEVWVGKTNVGRSAAPRKREGGTLVERPSNERWWPAAGVQHPHCRGRWVTVVEKPPEVSQEFADWLNARLASVAPAPPPDADDAEDSN